MVGGDEVRLSGNGPARAGDRRLILVRHALTVQAPAVPAELWRLADGAREACLGLAEQLRRLGPKRIVTSIHGKAAGTGRFLAEALALPRETAVGLEEHERTGVEYLADEEFLAALKRLFTRPNELVLGTETATEALNRFEAALRSRLESAPGENLVVVSHATVMALFMARHNSLDSFELWKTIGMPEAFVLELPSFRLAQRLAPG
jgi:broad specificity phosphatase PhoE